MKFKIPFLFLLLSLFASSHFVFPSIRDSDFCILDAADLALPDVKDLAAKAKAAASELGYSSYQLTYVGRGGDKAIFRLNDSEGKKIGIGVSLTEKPKGQIYWEAVVAPGTSKEKGIKGITEVKGQPGVITWEWSDTTLDKEIPHFHKLSQSDPLKFIDQILQIADTLDTMHAPVGDAPARLHRDVKLQNIHVSKLPGDEVELTLSDFGLSAIKEKGKGGKPEWKLEPGLRPEKGTPLYLNTSRLLGEVSEADDIPAFGMALGELLMGKRIDQLSPGQTYLVRYHGDIPQIRLPISKITPDAPPDLAFIADYSIHLAKTMREVRELMGDATSLRLKLSDKLGNAAPAKEKVRVEFEKMAFKKYLVADLKNADESKRKAAIRFVFRSENLIDELIASKDLSRKEKSELITLIKADVEKGTLDDTKLKGLMMGSVNPYYSKEGYQKALKSLTGWRSYLPF